MVKRLMASKLAISAFGLLAAVLVIARIGSACTSLCDGHVDSRLRNPEAIVRDGRLLGLDDAQLESAVGKPAQGWHFEGWDQAYYIGSDGTCVDSRWLVVRFGPDRRVVGAGITND